MVELCVHMVPIGKARARVLRSGHAYTPTSTREAEQTIRDAYMIYRRDHEGITFGTPIELQLRVNILRPKSVKWLRPTVRPDIDNYLKLCCDALNNVAYSDDSWIVAAGVEKGYVDDPARQGFIIILEEAT